MCGIAGLWGAYANPLEMAAAVEAMRHRGPDGAGIVEVDGGILGHVRLSIMDPTPASDQPFRYKGGVLVYNGEMWNHREVRARLEKAGHRFKTRGDTEVVAHLLHEKGAAGVREIDGMFALAWAIDGRVLIARDRFGEIPLHFGWAGQDHIAFASEIKALRALGVPRTAHSSLYPGELIEIADDVKPQFTSYYDPPSDHVPGNEREASESLASILAEATRSRAMSDVPVCTLLSGGIDSAVVAHHLSRNVKDLTAFTAVLDESSPDLRRARVTAEAIGIKLIEVKVPPPTAQDLRDTARIIEMGFKAQVEIAWACRHLARAIRERGFKVTYSGEGSDELWASYGFAYHGVKKRGWHAYRKDLFIDQHRKNFPRCNKVFMSEGVECRLPFLHVPVVEFALSLGEECVRSGGKEKGVLREAYRGVLPDRIVGAPKTAFQDGMGLKRRIEADVPNRLDIYAEAKAAFG